LASPNSWRSGEAGSRTPVQTVSTFDTSDTYRSNVGIEPTLTIITNYS
jgi:hypothetical protein